MFSALIFDSNYFNLAHHKTVLFTVFLLMLNAPAMAQTLSHSRICRAYELELRKIDYSAGLSTRQASRYQQLTQMQEQAKADSKRYSCNPASLSNGSNSEECRYINTSQQRIETALNQISKQAATPQQRHMRQVIYTDMRHYNCRLAQNIEQLMQENRYSAQSKARNRIQQTYKKPKILRQSELQPPDALQTIPAANRQSARAPVEPSFSILTEHGMNNTKTAENTPPPVFEAIDYVPNARVRRVGPEYLPGQ